MSNKRNIAASVILAFVLALGVSPIASASTVSKSYGLSKSATYKSYELFDAGNQKLDGMKSFKYKGKKYNCYDVQAMGMDSVNKRYYITRTDGGNSRAFIFSAPFSATKGTDWTCVGMYTGGWLKHANSMCAVPCGKGTKLYIASNSSKLRCVYIPNAAKPNKNVKKSTWVMSSFEGWSCTPYGISYDMTSKKFIVRNGLSSSGGAYYSKCFVFKAPTTATTGTHTVKASKYTARFSIVVPKSVTAPAGLLAKGTKKASIPNWSRQDMCYDGTNIYQGFSNTNGGKYKGVVASNSIVTWKVGSVKSIEQTYKKYKKKSQGPCWYFMNKALFDKTIKWSTQGYEVEGLDATNGNIFVATNEGYNGNFDKIRWFRAI